MVLAFPAVALVGQPNAARVLVALSEDKIGILALAEAGVYVTAFPAVKQGDLAYEALLNSVCNALREKHKADCAEAMQSGSHTYACDYQPVATFADSLVYENMGEFYQVSYSVNADGGVTIADDDVQVVAQFTPVMKRALSESVSASGGDRGLNESVDLVEEVRTGTLAESKIDRDSGVIRNTVLINSKSANGKVGRIYTPKALQQIAQMSEGLVAYANHVPDKANAFKPRDVREIIGRHRNVRYDDARQRVTSDLHVLPEQRAWVFDLAEHMGDIVGNSVVSRGAVRVDGDGVEHVEEIMAVRSGDLVTDPATTRGLYEHRERAHKNAPPNPNPQEETMEKVTIEAAIKALLESGETAKVLVREQFGFGAQITALTEEKTAALAGKKTAEDTVAAEQAAHAATKKSLTEAQAEIDTFKAKDAIAEKKSKAVAFVEAHDLGKKFGKVEHVVSETFKASLLEADEAKWQGLCDDRLALVSEAAKQPARPLSSVKGGETVQEHREDGDSAGADAHARMARAIGR